MQGITKPVDELRDQVKRLDDRIGQLDNELRALRDEYDPKTSTPRDATELASAIASEHFKLRYEREQILKQLKYVEQGGDPLYYKLQTTEPARDAEYREKELTSILMTLHYVVGSKFIDKW